MNVHMSLRKATVTFVRF